MANGFANTDEEIVFHFHFFQGSDFYSPLVEKYCSKPWWSIIAVFQSQHPHISLLFNTSAYWIITCCSFTSSPCLEAMENYQLAKMKLLWHSSCGAWQGSQQLRTPTFKQGQRHGSHVDTAELRHSRAPWISGYPSCCSPTVFQTSFLLCLIKLFNIQKEEKGSSLDVEKKISIKRSLKDYFFLAVLGND